MVIKGGASAGTAAPAATTASTRRAFLETHADTPTLVMPAHFPTPGAGRIVGAGDAWRFRFSDED